MTFVKDVRDGFMLMLETGWSTGNLPFWMICQKSEKSVLLSQTWKAEDPVWYWWTVYFWRTVLHPFYTWWIFWRKGGDLWGRMLYVWRNSCRIRSGLQIFLTGACFWGSGWYFRRSCCQPLKNMQSREKKKVPCRRKEENGMWRCIYPAAHSSGSWQWKHRNMWITACRCAVWTMMHRNIWSSSGSFSRRTAGWSWKRR